jgi:hypothetical protein
MMVDNDEYYQVYIEYRMIIDLVQQVIRVQIRRRMAK